MKNILRGMCVVVFVFGAASLFQAQKKAAGFQIARQADIASQSVDVNDTERAQAFVIEYVDSNVSPDGTIAITGSTTRFVKADGEWRLVIRRNSGQASSPQSSKEVSTYAGTPDGVFEKKPNSATRRFVSPSSVSPQSDQAILKLYRSHNYLRTHPDFVRMDEVAGLKVYVLRTVVTDNPTQWQERAYSPRTGLTALRSVIHMSDGSEIRREAVSIEFKEITEDLNHDLKTLPITPNEKKIQ